MKYNQDPQSATSVESHSATDTQTLTGVSGLTEEKSDL